MSFFGNGNNAEPGLEFMNSCYLFSLGAVADFELTLRTKKVQDDVMVVSMNFWPGGQVDPYFFAHCQFYRIRRQGLWIVTTKHPQPPEEQLFY